MKKESIVGFLLFFILLIGSLSVLDDGIAIRFLIGLAFGFSLVRASIGFAGSVNKLYRAGSAEVARTIVWIFIVTSAFVALLISGDESSYNLSIYPINFGLLVGGILFGFGMAMSSCCATGSLTDLSSGFSRAMVTIFFFGMGVFLGFDIQKSSSFVKDSYFSSVTGWSMKGGVFLPDYFSFDGFNGYLGAFILTMIFGLLAIKVANSFDKSDGVKTEVQLTLFERTFVKPWKMYVSVLAISSIFTFLLYFSHKGWSASSALGIWFGKFLMLFGVQAESLAAFTSKDITLFVEPLTSHTTSMQNIGIVLGSVMALLIAGVFKEKFIVGLKITPKGFATFALGGFLMGIGTRLSNGCNVGALYTPIAEFSLSGWIYLVFVVVGGVLGNMFVKRYISSSCSVV